MIGAFDRIREKVERSIQAQDTGRSIYRLYPVETSYVIY